MRNFSDCASSSPKPDHVICRDTNRQASIVQVARDSLKGSSMPAEAVKVVVGLGGHGFLNDIEGALMDIAAYGRRTAEHQEPHPCSIDPRERIDRLQHHTIIPQDHHMMALEMSYAEAERWFHGCMKLSQSGHLGEARSRLISPDPHTEEADGG